MGFWDVIFGKFPKPPKPSKPSKPSIAGNMEESNKKESKIKKKSRNKK